MNTPLLITAPGKFENEPRWAPHFLDLAHQGFEDDYSLDEGGFPHYTFRICEADRIQFPELVGIERIFIWEDEFGFVYTRIQKEDNDD